MTKTILKGQLGKTALADAFVADPNATVTMTGEQECEAARPENRPPIDACKDAIRVRAHSKWEAAGCPDGDGVGFWLEAEREFNAERFGPSSVLR